MDDPWGSPWADESPHTLPELDKLGSKRSVTPDKTTGIGQGSKSPWDDDDGYGEWATLPATDEIQADDQDGPEQAEIGEWNTSLDKKLTPRKDYIRPDGSSWFSREMKPTDEGNLGLKIPQIASRPLSPDPWAKEATEKEGTSSPTQLQESNTSEESTTHELDKNLAQTGATAIKDDDRHVTKPVVEFDESLPSKGNDGGSAGTPSINHNQEEATAVLDGNATNIQVEVVTQGESLASRPSSSPSDQSHHDEILTESPRTSFEEEDKWPKLEREGSSKVKEMVRLFNGLAVDEGSIDLPGHPGDVGAGDDRFDTPVAAQSEDDFGDFEEGMSRVSTKTDPAEERSTKNEPRPQDTTKIHRTSNLSTSTDEPTIHPSEQPFEPHAPVQFELDLSLLGPIFGQTPDLEYLHADPKQAPEIDTVMAESFSSTGERKTWYRISRYSTMRKHDAGDEDSYIRINWKNAAVRAETLKIVERWIEEDRNGGGVILGGGARLGSMFGWGQKNSAPMSVAAALALASRSGNTGTHSDYSPSPTSNRNSEASPIHGSGASRKSLEHTSASRNSFQSPVSATVPQFSWSTGTPIIATVEATPVQPFLTSPSSSHQASDDSSSLPKMIKDPYSQNLPASEGPSARTGLFSAKRAEMAANGVPKLGNYPGIRNAMEAPAKQSPIKLDDDWGEMMSSPVLEDPPLVKEGIKTETRSGAMEVLSTSLVNKPPAMNLDHSSRGMSNNRVAVLQSGDGIFSAPSLDDNAIKLETTSTTTPKSDAWATADFSFFDGPAPSEPIPTPPTLISKRPIPSPVPVNQSRGSTREQAEQDMIVKSVVQSLPDLSYMLRR